MPDKPDGRRTASATKDWEGEFLKDIASDVEAKLSPDGFDAAYLKHSSDDRNARLHEAEFAVSKLVKLKGKTSSPRIETATRNELLKEIQRSLKRHYVVRRVAFDYSACRVFVWEVYLAGFLRLKHVITREEISEAEGSIKQAIENFNERVAELLESMCYAQPETVGRRPKSDIFEYEISATIHPAFSENEVCGQFALLRPDSSPDRMWELGLEFIDNAVDVHIENTKRQIEGLCFDEGLDLVDVGLKYVDCDEEVYAVHED